MQHSCVTTHSIECITHPWADYSQNHCSNTSQPQHIDWICFYIDAIRWSIWRVPLLYPNEMFHSKLIRTACLAWVDLKGYISKEAWLHSVDSSLTRTSIVCMHTARVHTWIETTLASYSGSVCECHPFLGAWWPDWGLEAKLILWFLQKKCGSHQVQACGFWKKETLTRRDTPGRSTQTTPPLGTEEETVRWQDNDADHKSHQFNSTDLSVAQSRTWHVRSQYHMSMSRLRFLNPESTLWNLSRLCGNLKITTQTKNLQTALHNLKIAQIPKRQHII